MTDVLRDMLLDALPRKPRQMPRWKIEFYRQCRLWHGYLSAFAFIALMFFSLTGLLLNHPEWLKQEDRKPQEISFTISNRSIAGALKALDPARALGALVDSQNGLGGVYASGEIDGDEAYLRYEGVGGNASVILDLKTGQAQATRQKADTVTILNDLHRGKNAGQAWKLLIDVSAAIFLILSLAGYILFFSLRYRLLQSLALTAVSIGVIFGVFILFVP